MKVLHRLEQVNFTKEQARVITEIFEEHQQELVTKKDLEHSTLLLQTDLRKTEASLKEDTKQNVEYLKMLIEATNKRLTVMQWTIGGGLGLLSILIAVLG